MIFSVSRRNGRARSNEPSKRELGLLLISCVVFAGGALNLAWALQPDVTPLAASPPPKASRAADGPSSYEGVVHGMQEDGDEAEEPPMEEVAVEQAIDEGTDDAPYAAGPSSAPGAADPPTSQPEGDIASPSPTVVIHHTAYQEIPVYRTVHHQVSVAREVVEQGRPRIEWSLCPVCMQRHDKAFNERLVDHVEKVLCSACGARHETAYDETRTR